MKRTEQDVTATEENGKVNEWAPELSKVSGHTHTHTHTHRQHTHKLIGTQDLIFFFILKVLGSSARLFAPWGSRRFFNNWGWIESSRLQPFMKLYSQTADWWQTQTERYSLTEAESHHCYGCEIFWLTPKWAFKMSVASKEERRAKQRLHKNIHVESWNPLACSLSLQFSTLNETIAVLSPPSVPASSVS